ncbi:hypothetical protein C8R47DRAFT_1270697 [Mycena vitilis]|nr:hypothetical protein C8R47DRAFT_1270697 [Mycena vitilis]
MARLHWIAKSIEREGESSRAEAGRQAWAAENHRQPGSNASSAKTWKLCRRRGCHYLLRRAGADLESSTATAIRAQHRCIPCIGNAGRQTAATPGGGEKYSKEEKRIEERREEKQIGGAKPRLSAAQARAPAPRYSEQSAGMQSVCLATFDRAPRRASLGGPTSPGLPLPAVRRRGRAREEAVAQARRREGGKARGGVKKGTGRRRWGEGVKEWKGARGNLGPAHRARVRYGSMVTSAAAGVQCRPYDSTADTRCPQHIEDADEAHHHHQARLCVFVQPKSMQGTARVEGEWNRKHQGEERRETRDERREGTPSDVLCRHSHLQVQQIMHDTAAQACPTPTNIGCAVRAERKKRMKTAIEGEGSASDFVRDVRAVHGAGGGPGKLHQRVVRKFSGFWPQKPTLWSLKNPKADKESSAQGSAVAACQICRQNFRPTVPANLGSQKPKKPDKVRKILASKTQHPDKDLAIFGPQKPKFPDNPLVELPGACWRRLACFWVERYEDGDSQELVFVQANGLGLLQHFLSASGGRHLASLQLFDYSIIAEERETRSGGPHLRFMIRSLTLEKFGSPFGSVYSDSNTAEEDPWRAAPATSIQTDLDRFGRLPVRFGHGSYMYHLMEFFLSGVKLNSREEDLQSLAAPALHTLSRFDAREKKTRSGGPQLQPVSALKSIQKYSAGTRSIRVRVITHPRAMKTRTVGPRLYPIIGGYERNPVWRSIVTFNKNTYFLPFRDILTGFGAFRDHFGPHWIRVFVPGGSANPNDTSGSWMRINLLSINDSIRYQSLLRSPIPDIQQDLIQAILELRAEGNGFALGLMEVPPWGEATNLYPRFRDLLALSPYLAGIA